MIAMIILLGVIGVEIALGILSVKKKSPLYTTKANVRLAELLIFILLVISPIIKWSFRWYGLGLILLIQAIIAVFKALKSKKLTMITKGKTIAKVALKSTLLLFMLVPVLVFPQDNEIAPTGDYGVKTVTYTWTDESRDETFTKEADHRSITVQFWYPTKEKESEEKAEDKFPLVIFSHGAFGIRASNTSTYTELASHGYVVCSIDHTYHAAFTKQTDGKMLLFDQGFMNEVNKLLKEEAGQMGEEKYEMTQGWLKLRTEDMTFCLNQIKSLVELPSDKEEVFSMIDLEKIGLMGHSLGGATAADLGRRDLEIKAVAVIDGTMLGEETGFENGQEQVTTEPYPVPILNFYNGESYIEIKNIEDIYPNTIASASQKDSYQIAIMNAGHMNFTDLPMVAPILAKALGTSSVNPKACMKYVNQTILEFFDGYLKGEPIHLPKEEVITIK